MKCRIARATALAAVLFAAFAVPAAAQVSTGRIDLTAADSSGAVLPGVTVDISGPQSETSVTDGTGEAHFLNLAPGTYTVSAQLSGFSDYLNKSVVVATGASVPLKVSMAIAGVSTQVQVTNEAPVVDTKNMSTSTHVTVEELQSIPSSRDPWVVLQTVPGIIVDRVNVGGAESGQQSNYQAKGALLTDNTWNLDGIPITDLSATGSSPTYYDFDMFQELQVTTGGAAVQSGTPGVQLNMVLKSGANTPHGSTRLYFENQSMQSTNLSAALASSIGGKSGEGNRINQYKDYGVELGGPLLKNRLWAWGSAAKTHVDIITLTGDPDRTELRDLSLKLTDQVNDNLRANFTYFGGDKEKFGREASPTRAPETTYDQTAPTHVFKGEGNFVFGHSMFLSVKAAHIKSPITLAAEGGPNKNWYIDDGGVERGTRDTYKSDRPQDTIAVDGNSFHGHHELKFGFGWRRAKVDSTDVYPGNGTISVHIGYPEMFVIVKRDWAAKTEGKYSSAYFGDTWTRDRLTANFGARWDGASSSLGSASVKASPVVPNLLPAITADPVKNAITQNAVTPRVGLTYALDEDRKTIARASYAIFASQLGARAANVISPIQYTGIYYYAVDLNGDRSAQTNEILFGLGNLGYYGFDPLNPKAKTVNQIGNYTTPLTHEIVAGFDRELMPNFGFSGTFTWRNITKTNWQSLIGVNASNYRQTGTLTGSTDPIGSFSVPYFALDASKIPAGAGKSYEQRVGYHQRYLGFEASAVKRMSNHWMGRFGFSTNDHREYFDGPDAVDDPTPSPSSPNKDGGLVVTKTAGTSKSNIYLVLPRYQVVANGLYQLPYGINLGGNWLLRQGYAEPFFRSQVSTGDPLGSRKNVLVVGDAGAFRLPRVSSLDARAEKAFRFGRTNVMVDLDIFNLFNSATVLGRTYDLRLTGPTGYNQVLEIMNPRIFRIGGRLNF